MTLPNLSTVILASHLNPLQKVYPQWHLTPSLRESFEEQTPVASATRRLRSGFSGIGIEYQPVQKFAVPANTRCCGCTYLRCIFVSVQEGDIPALFMLLETGQATVHDVDPYGLRLLYVRPPTWRQYNRD